MPLADLAQSAGDQVQRLLPPDLFPVAAAASQRPPDTFAVLVDGLQCVGLGAEEALASGILLVPANGLNAPSRPVHFQD